VKYFSGQHHCLLVDRVAGVPSPWSVYKTGTPNWKQRAKKGCKDGHKRRSKIRRGKKVPKTFAIPAIPVIPRPYTHAPSRPMSEKAILMQEKNNRCSVCVYVCLQGKRRELPLKFLTARYEFNPKFPDCSLCCSSAQKVTAKKPGLQTVSLHCRKVAQGRTASFPLSSPPAILQAFFSIMHSQSHSRSPSHSPSPSPILRERDASNSSLKANDKHTARNFQARKKGYIRPGSHAAMKEGSEQKEAEG